MNKFQITSEFQHVVVSLFIDGGMGLVLYTHITQRKQVYNYEANNVGVVYIEQTELFTCLKVIVIKSLTW